MCTHTRQVEHQRCSRTGRVQKNHKKTQYLMNTLYLDFCSAQRHFLACSALASACLQRLYLFPPLRLQRPQAMMTKEAAPASVFHLSWHGLSRMSRLSHRQMLSGHSLRSISSPITATSSPSWQVRDLNDHLMKVGLLALEGRALRPERLLPFLRSVPQWDLTMVPSQLQQAGCSRYLLERWGRQLRRQHLLHRSFR